MQFADAAIDFYRLCKYSANDMRLDYACLLTHDESLTPVANRAILVKLSAAVLRVEHYSKIACR